MYFGVNLISKRTLQSYAYLLFIAGIIIALDQLTKGLVRANLDFQDRWAPWPWMEPYLRIVHWKNTGAAFGIFQQFGGVFSVLSIIVSLGILYYFPQVPKEDWPLRLAMGFQLGGAVGNLIDRLTLGYVTDFISFMDFPVFNVADACISTGVVVLIIGVWIRERYDKEKEEIAAALDAAELSTEPVVEENPSD